MTISVIIVMSSVPLLLRYTNHELSTKLTHHCFDKKVSLRVCIEKYYESDAERHGVMHALSLLKERLTYDPSVQANCHETMHLLGRVAYKEYGSLGDAFVHGDYTCWSGYYHGVVEGALRGVRLKDISTNTLHTLCTGTTTPAYSFAQFNCVHGMGHAIMYVSHNDIPEALSRCDDLQNTWEQGHCATGVFMENSLADSDHPSKFLPTDDLAFPCNIVPSKYMEACYLVQGTFIVPHMNGDFQKAFAFCGTLQNSGYRTQCARGLGKEVAQRTFYSGEKTATLCESAPKDLRTACLFGSLQDFIGNTHDNNAGVSICEALSDPKEQASCNDLLKEISLTGTTTQSNR